ncbi:Sucrase/ferredoxin-like-domain-containing protein [Echria macrotheca]|uniref:Altered inheritance of mitochondria protein 32 n=1 Tax=Echria macrotheca TaxID=438768 RepID=A0AAJ0FBC2_9PEZI|nr:Sucrase/ferredoxin-like-domain-containing protein [Echria macrotheca]
MFARSLRGQARAFQSPKWRRYLSSPAQPETPAEPATRRYRKVVGCPEPRCPCAPTPKLPDGLEIDRTTPFGHSMPRYDEQVVICTGKTDWPSRIEDDADGHNLAADLKKLIGAGGSMNDPFNNISILNSSFAPSVPKREEAHNASAYLLPSFTYVPYLPRESPASVEALVKGYLLAEKPHPAHKAEYHLARKAITRKPSYRKLLSGVRPVEDVLVLICGHGGRDQRCGIFGPVLKDEFETRLRARGVEVLTGPEPDRDYGVPKVKAAGDEDEERQRFKIPAARVGLISHIGGHKYAGNVIIYVPPKAKTQSGWPHLLGGHGIWYGRVEPRHVDGIVTETILEGNIIEELFRGGVDQKRRSIEL